MVAIALAALPTVPSGAAGCDHSLVPYNGIAGASLTPVDHVTKDKPAVSYTRWSGTVPGLRRHAVLRRRHGAVRRHRAAPTIVMAHGFTDDKTVWEETGKSDRVISEGRPAAEQPVEQHLVRHRGATSSSTTRRAAGGTRAARTPPGATARHARRRSACPSSTGSTSTTSGGRCATRSGWPAASCRAAWPTPTGWRSPAAPTAVGRRCRGRLLAGSTMCGGSGDAPGSSVLTRAPARPTASSCPGPRRTARRRSRGRSPLPLYTFADLLQVLAPNGRAPTARRSAPPDGSHTDPFGVPIVSTVAGLLAAGSLNGFFALPRGRPGCRHPRSTRPPRGRQPVPQADPLRRPRRPRLPRFKSPITTPPQGRVPIFWVQGLTDPLFPALEALPVRNHVLAGRPDLPVQDVPRRPRPRLHRPATGRVGPRQGADERLRSTTTSGPTARRTRRPSTSAPRSPAASTTTHRCATCARPRGTHLHPQHVAFTSTDRRRHARRHTPGPAGLATDPITTATLPLPGAYRGCRIMRPSQTDPTVGHLRVRRRRGPRAHGRPGGRRAVRHDRARRAAHARLWDVAPDGSAQGLVTRGTYRVVDGPGADGTPGSSWPRRATASPPGTDSRSRSRPTTCPTSSRATSLRSCRWRR